MEFENNFVYPFSSTMYDPVLKIRVAINVDKEMYREEDGMITIYLNPNIRPDNLTAPFTQEELEFKKKFHTPGAEIIPFKPFSEGESKFDDIHYNWSVLENKIRLYIRRIGQSFPDIVKKSQNKIPELSGNVRELYLYIIKNYINLSYIRDYCFPAKKYPDANRVEICVTSEDFFELFKLNANEYSEVEPGWFCVASREFGQ